MIKSGLFLFLGIISLYYLALVQFFPAEDDISEFPSLRARLGTVMWHSSDYGGVDHLYCYYPKSETGYNNKAGEYLLKRVQQLTDCQGWLGLVNFKEGSWVSEREKVWWSQHQKAADEQLAKLSSSPGGD